MLFDPVGCFRGVGADGRFVTFISFSTNLVSPPATDANSTDQVYLHDITNSRTFMVSVDTLGTKSSDGHRRDGFLNFRDGSLIS